LVEATGVSSADTVLVHGASGGVGSIAVQLCRLRGATVLGTASSPRLDAVQRLGATAVNSGEGVLQRLRSAVPEGFTVALDTVGTEETIRASADLVADRDRVAVIAGYALATEFGMRRLGFGPGADPGVALRDAARGPLLDMAGRGDLVVEVARTFPLDEVREALSLVASGKAGGKLVLVP
jgi:NADPH:quinone reductase-like Zn-dependent oxidoreductase